MGQVRTLFSNLGDIFLQFRAERVAVAGFVIAAVALFVYPLPPRLLDFLLVCNIVLALTLLLRGLFASNPMRLFSFPTILLLATLFRLALNVSSTRLILLNGDRGMDAAGQVIESFGNFVVQGDFIVGAIIFVVIAVVNFVVIAKGSARVAEVAARFVLDALPGKQLAIDADLRSGNISRQEASQRRDSLQRESQFYGAMDGAMKFVQGDAIAGLIITFINAIGGVSIGVISRGLEFQEALNLYGVLTIGDGLVSILPSLLVSVSAGIVVTYVAGRQKSTSARGLVTQIFGDSEAVVLTAICLLAVSVFPGFPFLPFFVIAVGLLAMVGLRKSASPNEHAHLSFTPIQERFGLDQSQRSSEGGDVEFGGYLDVARDLDSLVLSVDPKVLASFLGVSADKFNRGQHNQVGEQFAHIMHDIYLERGVLLPQVRVKVDEKLGDAQYQILIRGQLIKAGTVDISLVFVTASRSLLTLFGVELLELAKHPLDIRQGAWVREESAGIDALKSMGIEVLSPREYLLKELAGEALQVVHEVFGLDEIMQLLVPIRAQHPNLLEAVFESGLLSYGEFAEVVRRLVREQVNVRDLKLVLEGVAEYCSLHKDEGERIEWLSALHAYLRLVMNRSIVSDLLSPGGKLRAFVLSEEVEDELRSAVAMWDNPRTKLPLSPDFEDLFRENAERLFRPVFERGVLPLVVVCSEDVRLAAREFFARERGMFDDVRTVAYQELDTRREFESIAVLGA